MQPEGGPWGPVPPEARYVRTIPPTSSPLCLLISSRMHFPNRDEFVLRAVVALPMASRSGLAWGGEAPCAVRVESDMGPTVGFVEAVQWAFRSGLDWSGGSRGVQESSDRCERGRPRQHWFAARWRKVWGAIKRTHNG